MSSIPDDFGSVIHNILDAMHKDNAHPRSTEEGKRAVNAILGKVEMLVMTPDQIDAVDRRIQSLQKQKPAQERKPRKPTPATAKNGDRVTVTLDNGVEYTGTITDQPVTGKMGILLNVLFYFGNVRTCSRTSYRLLINNRIIVKPIADVRLVRIESPLAGCVAGKAS